MGGKHPGTVQYVATLQVVGSEDAFQGDEPSKSKKEAEHLAARAAMKEMFPDAFKRLENGGAAKGQKRKAAAMSVPVVGVVTKDAKQLLIEGAQILIGTLEKGAIVYECSEEGGQFTATVTLN